MKTVAVMLAAAMAAYASFAESYYVVTTTDFLGNKSFKTMTRDQVKETQAKIKRENSALPKVLNAIKRDFAANPEAHEGEKFYGGKLKPRTFKQNGPFSDYEKAQEKTDRFQNREDEKLLDMEKESDMRKLSDREKEKRFDEAKKEEAINKFAEDVQKKIDEMLGEKK